MHGQPAAWHSATRPRSIGGNETAVARGDSVLEIEISLVGIAVSRGKTNRGKKGRKERY